MGVGRPFVLAGIPAYNEEKGIARVLVETMSHVDQVVVCDDGSQDATGKIAQKLGSVVISHKRNAGYGASIASIFEKAREMHADILVTLDSDGQHNPKDIQALIQPIIDNRAEVVIGSRFLEARDSDNTSAYRRFGIKTLTKISNVVSQANLTDSQSGFRAYSKKAIDSIFVTERGMGASTEIIFKAQASGLKIAEVPINVEYHEEASTHNSFYHGIDVMMSTLKFISIEHPLRFYGIPGLASLILAIYFGVWALHLYTAEGRLVTNIALLAIGLLMIGLVLLTTSVILYVVINVVRETRRVQ
jgi:glycosyltransferase involved in cell wall biosynthesis